MRFWLFLGVCGLLGCHRAPAPRAPVVMVPVADCNCEEDDEEVELVRVPRPVEYVRLSEWTPPPTAQRVAAEIEPRGDGPPDITPFPPLTLHRPVGSTTIQVVPRTWPGGVPIYPQYQRQQR